MPTIQEQTGLPIQELAGPLGAGIADISQQRPVRFFTYRRAVLPLDGFIFWIRTNTFEAGGMLHHALERTQNETDIIAAGPVVFTTMQRLVALDAIDTDTLVVGLVEGRRYSFARHGMFAEQPAVWSYQGSSIPASLDSQLIDDPTTFNPSNLIVSDSLPAWLQIATYDPEWLQIPNPGLVLYPSYAVPDNLPPPFGVVHNEPESIVGIDLPILQAQTMPGVAPTVSSQLTSERVRVTLYGANNATAIAFLNTVLRYSRDTNLIGLANVPSIRDGKRPWPEGMILAQQKIIDFQITYVQSAIYAVALQLIEEATTTVQASITCPC